MSVLIEILRAYPLLSTLLIAGPLLGGLVGAYMGFDNLRTRFATQQQQTRIESRQIEIRDRLGELAGPVESLRRVEAQLEAQGQTFDVLRLVLAQYDQLRDAVAIQERFSQLPDSAGRIAAADHILSEMRTLLGGIKTVPGPGGQALIIRTAPNTFRVTFSVPMRVPPGLSFSNLPAGIETHVIEKTNIGFTVVFTPSTIPVETFGFIADAEL